MSLLALIGNYKSTYTYQCTNYKCISCMCMFNHW